MDTTVDGEQEINKNSLSPLFYTIEAVTIHENLHMDIVIGSTWIRAGVKLVRRPINLTKATTKKGERENIHREASSPN